MAKSDSVTGRPLRGTFQERTTVNILQGRRSLSNVRAAGYRLQGSGFTLQVSEFGRRTILLLNRASEIARIAEA